MPDIKMNISAGTPKTTTYKVAGKTLAEAKDAMDRRDEWGLYDSTQGQKSGAQTDANGNVTSVTLTLAPVIEMPSWSGYTSATKEQKASWDAMYAKLLAHENKHHEIQKAAIEDLKKAIKSAKTLDANGLRDLIAKNQADTQKKQDAYDSSSGHGAKEGVTLDLSVDPSE